MKLLIVANDTQIKENLYTFTDVHGGSVIHYTHPVKCMDNFDEIEPDVVIFNAPDFPRHWKLAAQALREKWDRKIALFILLTDENFPAEEADKAAYLGVNALLSTAEFLNNNFSRLEKLVSRYRIAPERKDGPVFRTLKEPYNLMFMNPENLRFISGKVERELMNRILFFPAEPTALERINVGDLIPNCSVERNGEITTCDAVVRAKGEFLELEILSAKEMKGIA
ncbi:MAG: hypothetical protein PQJ59_07485 [Spirochaetales bacterium]|nr:hypothetical protein [Spirochaetales bacterium]